MALTTTKVARVAKVGRATKLAPATGVEGATGGRGRSIYDVAVLQKALDLLEVLAEEPDLGLSELSEKTGASKASTYRMLSTLESRGFVVKRGDTRKYAPGASLVALSCSVVARLDLANVARPFMEELKRLTNETINLAILADGQVLYVNILESARGLRMAAHIGARDALHSTALGKVILSALPAPEARQLLSAYRRLAATPRTIVGLEALMDELGEVARRGYSVDDEENEIGARCIGVAIKDLSGRAVGALSVSGPASRMSDPVIAQIGQQLKDAAEGIEEQMGYGKRRTLASQGAAS
jgi:IclR family acetate operon transcriptional repressor